MKIAVDAEILLQIAEAVKNLPVDCSKFEAADQWVGIVIALNSLVQNSEEAKTAKEETLKEE